MILYILDGGPIETKFINFSMNIDTLRDKDNDTCISIPSSPSLMSIERVILPCHRDIEVFIKTTASCTMSTQFGAVLMAGGEKTTDCSGVENLKICSVFTSTEGCKFICSCQEAFCSKFKLYIQPEIEELEICEITVTVS